MFWKYQITPTILLINVISKKNVTPETLTSIVYKKQIELSKKGYVIDISYSFSGKSIELRSSFIDNEINNWKEIGLIETKKSIKPQQDFNDLLLVLNKTLSKSVLIDLQK